MFELRLSDDRYYLEAIASRCINCKKATGLFLRTSTLEEMITKFVLNAIMHHVGMLSTISSNEEMKYEIDESNHNDWSNKGPWYNAALFSRLHGSLFEYFMTHARTNKDPFQLT